MPPSSSLLQKSILVSSSEINPRLFFRNQSSISSSISMAARSKATTLVLEALSVLQISFRLTLRVLDVSVQYRAARAANSVDFLAARKTLMLVSFHERDARKCANNAVRAAFEARAHAREVEPAADPAVDAAEAKADEDLWNAYRAYERASEAERD